MEVQVEVQGAAESLDNRHRLVAAAGHAVPTDQPNGDGWMREASGGTWDNWFIRPVRRLERDA